MRSVKKTHDDYLKEYSLKFPSNFNKIDRFEEIKGYIVPFNIHIGESSYTTTISMLLTGKFVTINSSNDKNSCFIEKLNLKHPNTLKIIELLESYKTSQTKFLVKNKYGICNVTPNSLLNGQLPTIMSAVNPTEYWINQSKEKYGDKLDYSLVNYINSNTEVLLRCKIHNISFNILPAAHLNRNCGCEKCGKESLYLFRQENTIGWMWEAWEQQGLDSKNFESFKFYILKCWNEEEEFYKIGKTFLDINKRFTKGNLCYFFDSVHFHFGEAGYIYDLENELHRKYKSYKYKPLNWFAGHTECYITDLPIQEIINLGCRNI